MSQWEQLHGATPSGELSRHPSGNAVALRVDAKQGHITVDRAGIWDPSTGRLLWAPEGATALAWTRDGDRLLALVESYKPKKRPFTSTPFQSDITHRCELYEWPSRRLVSATELDFPTGSLIDVIPSPSLPIAAYVWLDQTEAGMEFLDLTGDRVAQIPDYGYFGDSNLIEGPVFSPDGQYAVASYGAGVWWAEEREEPSRGGRFKAGWVVVIDVTTGKAEERDVLCEVAPGWLPDDPDSIAAEMLSRPEFQSETVFAVTTSNGRTVTFDLSSSPLE